VLGQYRSSQRHQPQVLHDEDALTAAIVALALRVRSLWLSPRHGSSAHGRLRGERQESAAHMESRGPEGARQAA
jgi:hypothetical protein